MAHASESEKYLTALAERAFLKLWTYPNLFVQKGGSKELCDLLLIFGEHVVVFSDKNCKYDPAAGSERVQWRRWYSGAVLESAHQVVGAERSLRAGLQVFRDRKCTVPLSLPLPPNPTFHHVLTVGGASAASELARGGRGSLIGTNRSLEGCCEAPFRLGCRDRRGQFFHVFDRNGLDAVLATLDTARDFLDYLQSREKLFRSDCEITASSEEDLLGSFMLSFDHENKAKDFPELKGSHFFDRSHWPRWQGSNERLARDAANRQSYYWDHLVEKFTYYFLNAASDHTSCSNVEEFEQMIRWLSCQSRFKRRLLSATLLDVVPATQPGQVRRRFLSPFEEGDPYWVFVIAPQPGFAQYEEYREVRRRLLSDHMCVIKYLHPDALDIVGIAVGETNGEMTEDVMVMDCRDSPGLAQHGERLHLEQGIFKNPSVQAFTSYEYPT